MSISMPTTNAEDMRSPRIKDIIYFALIFNFYLNLQYLTFVSYIILAAYRATYDNIRLCLSTLRANRAPQSYLHAARIFHRHA